MAQLTVHREKVSLNDDAPLGSVAPVLLTLSFAAKTVEEIEKSATVNKKQKRCFIISFFPEKIAPILNSFKIYRSISRYKLENF
ncbi:hypothetical protein [uncultured Bartonella sp.]|uniref:hypothetical protein n=1 Tax=uncultured Bartonella sp. TaxID=104108 RepID=UPI0026385BF9|nr:hypothetical protein [uncultured Bartonella sp.]